MTSSGNGHFFEVRSSQSVLHTLKQIQAEEIKNGQGKRFLEALRALYDRLRRDPQGFGEPLYRLPALRLVIYTALVTPLAVHYAVHEERPLVFIKWLQSTSM
jgi:hypothetical protein